MNKLQIVIQVIVLQSFVKNMPRKAIFSPKPKNRGERRSKNSKPKHDTESFERRKSADYFKLDKM